MARIYLDTNIVADILDASRANHPQAMRLMEQIIENDDTVCISEDMLSTLFYISKNKTQTLAFVQNVILIDWEVLSFGKELISEAVGMTLSNGGDFEDVLQCLCAKHHGCEVVVTSDREFVDCGMRVVGYDGILGGEK